jgi:hypothetical protein
MGFRDTGCYSLVVNPYVMLVNKQRVTNFLTLCQQVFLLNPVNSSFRMYGDMPLIQ